MTTLPPPLTSTLPVRVADFASDTLAADLLTDLEGEGGLPPDSAAHYRALVEQVVELVKLHKLTGPGRVEFVLKAEKLVEVHLRQGEERVIVQPIEADRVERIAAAARAASRKVVQTAPAVAKAKATTAAAPAKPKAAPITRPTQSTTPAKLPR